MAKKRQKSFFFFSFVFELLYAGASRKKKKIENRKSIFPNCPVLRRSPT
jgi:hypothetical protein